MSQRAEQYRHGEDRPLGGYVRALAVYGGLVGVGTVAARRWGPPMPDRIDPYDVLLLGVATHKTARTITKDAVTSPLRAPFTRYEGTGGPAELHEEVVAAGPGHAVGELLTCPFCMAQWVATGFTFGLLIAPRATRAAMAVMSARALSDGLQLVYAIGEREASK